MDSRGDFEKNLAKTFVQSQSDKFGYLMCLFFEYWFHFCDEGTRALGERKGDHGRASERLAPVFQTLARSGLYKALAELSEVQISTVVVGQMSRVSHERRTVGISAGK